MEYVIESRPPEPTGSISEILDYERGSDFYDSAYCSTYGRSFRSGTIENELRQELRVFAELAATSSEEEEMIVELGRLLFYYLPEVPISLFSNRASSKKISLTPERATKIAFTYIRGIQEEDETIQELEDKLVDHLMDVVDFQIRKDLSQQSSNLKERKKAIENKIQDLRKKEENLQRLYDGDDLSFFESIYSGMNQSQIRREFARVQKEVEQKECDARELEAIIRYPEDYRVLEHWMDKRDQKLNEAIQNNTFETTLNDLLKREERKGQRQYDRGLLDSEQMQEFFKQALSALQNQTSTAGESDGAETGDASGSASDGSEPVFPSYLELKENYSQEEIQKIFSDINNNRFSLGPKTSKVRTMLLSGRIKQAIQEIRQSVVSDDDE